jgi:hypothetical protein
VVLASRRESAKSINDITGVSGGRYWEPFGLPASNNHPAATASAGEHNDDYLGQLTQVLSNRAVNEVRIGKAAFGFTNRNPTTWSNHWQGTGALRAGPRHDYAWKYPTS